MFAHSTMHAPLLLPSALRRSSELHQLYSLTLRGIMPRLLCLTSPITRVHHRHGLIALVTDTVCEFVTPRDDADISAQRPVPVT